MDQTLYVCVGICASGKSTWAMHIMQGYKSGVIKRVNKDLLREILDKSFYNHDNEDFINRIEKMIVYEALLKGCSVIVDDTNLNPKTRLRWKTFLENYNTKHESNIKLVYKEFPISIEEAIDRDRHRAHPVGERVIRHMAEQHSIPQVKPKAVVCDLDGTLSINPGRGYFDYSRVSEDIVNEDMANLIQAMWRSGYMILFVSGRDNTCFDETLAWIKKIRQFSSMCSDDFQLFMRDPSRVDEKGNKIADNIIKEEIYHHYIEPSYDVRLVFDDRSRVVDMWRQLGLQCYQVAPGDF